MALTNPAAAMTQRIASMQDFKLYRELSWEGSFEDYLQIVREVEDGPRADLASCPARDASLPVAALGVAGRPRVS